MKRALIVCLIGATAAAGAATAAVVVSPRAQLIGFGCHRASAALNRWTAVTAVMRPVSGTERMALKFDLQRADSGSGSFMNVHGGDLGKWRYPTDPVTLGQQPDDVWRKTKQVVNLQVPAVYRFRVAFRWTGAGGRTLQRSVRFSARCSQSR